jgi:hypothetical protein
MKKKILTLVVAMVLSMLTAVISGCAGNRISLVDQGAISVETKPSESVRILWTDVYQDGEDIIVYGAVRRRSHTSYPLTTHVDVMILAPDGEVLQEARTQDIYVPRRIPGKGVNWKRFEARFSSMPPQGSLVRLVSHSGLHNDAI